jgi:hypothetical protein
MMQMPHDVLADAQHNLQATANTIYKFHDWLKETLTKYSDYIAHLETTLHQQGGHSPEDKEMMQHVLTSLKFRLEHLRHLFMEVDSVLKNPAFNFEKNSHVLHAWTAHAAHAHRFMSNTVNQLAHRLFNPLQEQQTPRSSSRHASHDLDDD